MTFAVAVLCAPGTFPLRWRHKCPTCHSRRFAGLDAPWYGVVWTCLGCGDSWSDGQRMERPFQRGWRAKAMARAAQVCADAGRYTAEDHHRWLREQLAFDQEVKTDERGPQEEMHEAMAIACDPDPDYGKDLDDD